MPSDLMIAFAFQKEDGYKDYAYEKNDTNTVLS